MKDCKMQNVDVAYINAQLKKKGIAKYAFAESLSYDASWWGYIERSGGRVKKNVVALMCRMYRMDEDKVVIKPEPEPQPLPAGNPAVYSDDNAKVLITMLVRIEQKLNILLEKM